MRYTKNIIGLVAFALIVISSASAWGNNKVDPHYFIQKEMVLDGVVQPSVHAKSAVQEGLLLDVFIKSDKPEETRKKLIDLGARIGSVIGSVITVKLTDEMIVEVREWDEVVYIEMAKPLQLTNDLAVADTNVSSVTAGVDLPQSYDGTNVIIGIIDTGIDLTHPAFLDDNGNSRVLFVWDQNDNTGPGPTELVTPYGTEYTATDIANANYNHQDIYGHGTHVAGTAAGKDSVYPGVASGANLVITTFGSASSYDDPSGNIFSTSVCEAADYIFKKAAALGKPAVINISLGTDLGPHDGTSLFSECLDSLVESAPGRAIVVAAGNSAREQGGPHIGYEVQEGTMRGTTIIPMATGLGVYYTVDMWEAGDCAMDVAVVLWDVDTGMVEWTDWWGTGTSMAQTGGSYVNYYITRLTTNSPLNGKRHTMIVLDPKGGFNISKHFFSVMFSGTCSDFDAWTDIGQYHQFGIDEGVFDGVEYIPGNNESSVGIPATAANVIAVGSYNTRTSWTSILGDVWDASAFTGFIGEISSFSSRGPALSAAQGTKPNIVAPGAQIISALSSQVTPNDAMMIDSDHQIMQGTSMASPHVTGVVALMLQENPLLTHAEIMELLQSTTRNGGVDLTSSISTDTFVGAVPNATWGYGKVDAHEAVRAVAGNYGAVEPDEGGVGEEQPDVGAPTVTGNASSGGGCSLVSSEPFSPVFFLMPFAALIVAAYRKRFRR